MKSDDEIKRECAEMEPIIGPTKTAWYRDACLHEYGMPPALLIQACRVRECVRELAEVSAALKTLAAAAQTTQDMFDRSDGLTEALKLVPPWLR